MTSLTPKKLSRRDAIKLLGAAAGASVLANLLPNGVPPSLPAVFSPPTRRLHSHCVLH